MDRLFQWAWDRYGPRRYPWVIFGFGCAIGVPSLVVVALMVAAIEGSSRYVEVVGITVVAMLAQYSLGTVSFAKTVRHIHATASGRAGDPAAALAVTYTNTRRQIAGQVVAQMLYIAALTTVVSGIAGATGWRLVQWAILGATYGVAIQLLCVHSLIEGLWRPIRAAIVGNTTIGDTLPRSRPTFAAWSNMSMLATAFAFGLGGAMLGAAFGPVREDPIIAVVIAGALTFGYGPVTLAVFTPLLRPVRDLAEGTERVAAGDYSQRLPVVQDDDLGALSGSFNRMQAGLAERQRLQAAFGTYVAPALAARLLTQGDDVFSGERREVTVFFIDIRDFTPFAEANAAEDVVTRLNDVFEIVVTAVVNAGGHVNKFLGDGALAVFGAPDNLARHAEAAMQAAVTICRRVADRFGGALHVGIGINTGVVIAGTIGAAGKLEFTLIGDAINVAARVEQLTKITGDTILLTDRSVAAMASDLSGLMDRGAYAVKGKSAPVQVFGLDPTMCR